MQIARLAGALALVFACHAFAAPDEPVMLNFVNVDIDTVVKAIGEISGKNFVLDPRVKGTVNIVSARPVPRELSYQILLSSLRMQGFSAVEGDGVIKIVPEADAKLHARVGNARRGDGDRLITKVFILRHGSANQLVPVIRPIISPNNTVAAMPQANAVVVTDYADNIRRIEAIIDSIESASAADSMVLPVKYASAIEMASQLNKLLQEGSTGAANAADGGRVTIVPDARSNVLLVRADSSGRLAKVKNLLTLLDQPSQAGANVRVVYLRNAEATRVAQTLRSLLSADAPAASNSAPASSQAANASGTAKATDSNSGALGSTIQADVANNALIMNVPDAMYQNLRNVIDMLDRRRAQVFVEALVVEVSAERAQEVGMQWQSLSGLGNGGTSVIGGTNFPATGNPGILNVATGGTAGISALAGSSGLTVGISKGTVTIPGIGQILNLGLLARALEKEAEGNVLSTPNLMTMDNEEAKIVIGQNVPFLTGSYSNTGNGGSNNSSVSSPFQTYERKDVGLTLKLTPQISEGGLVKMKILQEVSSVEETSRNNPAGLTTNKRAIETTVTVDDGSIVAIGGLIQESVSDGENKVPLLGDIPVLGWLFKYQQKQRKKTNLMVFLKPTILRDDGSARGLASDRYDYVIGDRQRQDGKLPLNAADAYQSSPAGGLLQQLQQSGQLPQPDSQGVAKP
ncbi:type II secretion system secretin GspD [Vogesella mureinivorans]|uniref:type II secretion system secretin GspD n=1 Tax=Vogesella mureinivorans TaxID=657276 RepID=UPI0011C7DF9B|nr:type II secretion system secretin GspD [Vogesella mureinivorans]